MIVPSLPGCVTYGDTIDESIEMTREAIELYIESLVEHGEEIPNIGGDAGVHPEHRSSVLNMRNHPALTLFCLTFLYICV